MSKERKAENDVWDDVGITNLRGKMTSNSTFSICTSLISLNTSTKELCFLKVKTDKYKKLHSFSSNSISQHVRETETSRQTKHQPRSCRQRHPQGRNSSGKEQATQKRKETRLQEGSASLEGTEQSFGWSEMA